MRQRSPRPWSASWWACFKPSAPAWPSRTARPTSSASRRHGALRTGDVGAGAEFDEGERGAHGARRCVCRSAPSGALWLELRRAHAARAGRAPAARRVAVQTGLALERARLYEQTRDVAHVAPAQPARRRAAARPPLRGRDPLPARRRAPRGRAATGTTPSRCPAAGSASWSATSSAAGSPRRARWASCAAPSARSPARTSSRPRCSSTSTRSSSRSRPRATRRSPTPTSTRPPARCVRRAGHLPPLLMLRRGGRPPLFIGGPLAAARRGQPRRPAPRRLHAPAGRRLPALHRRAGGAADGAVDDGPRPAGRGRSSGGARRRPSSRGAAGRAARRRVAPRRRLPARASAACSSVPPLRRPAPARRRTRPAPRPTS